MLILISTIRTGSDCSASFEADIKIMLGFQIGFDCPKPNFKGHGAVDTYSSHMKLFAGKPAY